MSDQNSLVWYINISHLNKYLFMDIGKALGAAVLLVIGIQVLPLGNTATTITTAIIAGLAFWGIALTVKLFTSFTGHKIRFLLDDEGVTARADEGKLGLSYVERQVSTLNSVVIGSSDTKLPWSSITGYEADPIQSIITLKKGAHGTMSLYCNEDNFNSILDIVREKTELKQEIV